MRWSVLEEVNINADTLFDDVRCKEDIVCGEITGLDPGGLNKHIFTL